MAILRFSVAEDDKRFVAAYSIFEGDEYTVQHVITMEKTEELKPIDAYLEVYIQGMEAVHARGITSIKAIGDHENAVKKIQGIQTSRGCKSNTADALARIRKIKDNFQLGNVSTEFVALNTIEYGYASHHLESLKQQP